MSQPILLAVHVLLSLAGIGSGFVVVYGFLVAKRLPAWTAFFLTTTLLTSVTGFFFQSAQFGPPHALGIISLLVLAVVLPALYVYRLTGPWRWLYVSGALVALYLNVFIGVVQAFLKIGVLRQLAPNQTELPFVAAQAIVLLVFVGLGIVSVKAFRPSPPGPAPVPA